MAAVFTGILVAVVAGLFGLGGSALAAQREHDRWLRQSRFAAYSDFLAAASRLTLSVYVRRETQALIAAEQAEVRLDASVEDDHLDALESLEQAGSRVALLGPIEVERHAGALFQRTTAIALREPDASRDGFNEARDEFVQACRAHLAPSADRRGGFRRPRLGPTLSSS